MNRNENKTKQNENRGQTPDQRVQPQSELCVQSFHYTRVVGSISHAQYLALKMLRTCIDICITSSRYPFAVLPLPFHRLTVVAGIANDTRCEQVHARLLQMLLLLLLLLIFHARADIHSGMEQCGLVDMVLVLISVDWY